MCGEAVVSFTLLLPEFIRLEPSNTLILGNHFVVQPTFIPDEVATFS
jgi:hypothetical protein